MQDRPVLGRVDVLTGEHRVDLLPQPAASRRRAAAAQGFPRDPVLGIVDDRDHRLDDELVAASRVRGEDLPQMGIADLPVVVGQGRPFLAGEDVGHADVGHALVGHGGASPRGPVAGATLVGARLPAPVAKQSW